MPVAADKFVRVRCPKCSNQYKVLADDAERFEASLPGSCLNCKPKPVEVDPALVARDGVVSQLVTRVETLERELLKMRGDLAETLEAVQQAVTTIASAPLPPSSAP